MGGGGRGGTGPEKSDVKSACLPRGFQSKTLAELEAIFTETAEAQELASGIGDAAEARQWLRTKLQAVGEKAGFPGVLGEALGVGPTPIPVPVPVPVPILPPPIPAPQVSQPGGSAPHSHSGTQVLWQLLVPSSPEGAVPVCRVRVGLPHGHWGGLFGRRTKESGALPSH